MVVGLMVLAKGVKFMSNCRIHGKKPYKVAVIHGGPGAAGSMKKLAQVLANDRGILEPIQTADSL
jgi:hypothetical protein